MKRTLFIVAVLVAFGFATGASAVSLSVVSNKTTYTINEVITLTVSGSDSGVTAYSAQGRLEYNEALVDAGTRVQIALGTGWTKQVPGTGSGFSFAFAQLANPAVSASALNDVTNTPFSTVTLTAQALGVVNVDWNTVTGSGFELIFFGLTTAPGTSFTIVPVPEPTTAALLGLGLVGLVLGGRRRS